MTAVHHRVLLVDCRMPVDGCSWWHILEARNSPATQESEVYCMQIDLIDHPNQSREARMERDGSSWFVSK